MIEDTNTQRNEMMRMVFSKKLLLVLQRHCCFTCWEKKTSGATKKNKQILNIRFSNGSFVQYFGSLRSNNNTMLQIEMKYHEMSKFAYWPDPTGNWIDLIVREACIEYIALWVHPHSMRHLISYMRWFSLAIILHERVPSACHDQCSPNDREQNYSVCVVVRIPHISTCRSITICLFLSLLSCTYFFTFCADNWFVLLNCVFLATITGVLCSMLLFLFLSLLLLFVLVFLPIQS